MNATERLTPAEVRTLDTIRREGVGYRIPKPSVRTARALERKGLLTLEADATVKGDRAVWFWRVESIAD